MSVYQNEIAKIFKMLMLKYETKIVTSKKNTRKLEHFSVVELRLLEYLREKGLVKQNELFEIIDYKRSKLLSVIKKLMDVGYISRLADEADKRSTFIMLSEKGKQVMLTYDQNESEFLDFVLKDMTINEEKAIVKFLSKINQTDYMK